MFDEMMNQNYKAQFDKDSQDLLVLHENQSETSLWSHFLDSVQTTTGLSKLKENIWKANSQKNDQSYRESKKILDNMIMQNRLSNKQRKSLEKLNKQGGDTDGTGTLPSFSEDMTHGHIKRLDEIDKYASMVDKMKDN